MILLLLFCGTVPVPSLIIIKSSCPLEKPEYSESYFFFIYFLICTDITEDDSHTICYIFSAVTIQIANNVQFFEYYVYTCKWLGLWFFHLAVWGGGNQKKIHFSRWQACHNINYVPSIIQHSKNVYNLYRVSPPKLTKTVLYLI